MDTDIQLQRYNSVAIILHWVMAIAFLLMLTSGIVMEYVPLEKSLEFQLDQWHKSLGVLLLLTFIVRIIWRVISTLRHQIPPLPQHFSKTEKRAAKFGHWGLYFFMLAMPITGWIMVSASVYGLPTIVFNWFEWPHIPNLQGNETVAEIAETLHFYFAIGFGLMILVHIGAVIKHAVKDRENLLPRIWWVRRLKSQPK